MRFPVALTVILMAFLLPLSTLTVSAGPDGIMLQENPDGSFSVRGDYVSLEYNGDLTPTLDSIGISGSSAIPVFEPLFESISIQGFVPTSDPMIVGESVHVSSSDMSVEFHNNPVATMRFEATGERLVSFALEEDIGAIVDMNTAFLGKGGTTAELVVQGDATLEKSFNHVYLRMKTGSRCFFRASVLPGESIRQEISAGIVVGELFLAEIDSNVVSDLVQYQSISMSPTFVSDRKVVVDVSGDFPDGRAIILMLDQDMFGVHANEIVLQLDGDEVARASDSDEVLMADGESKFFASQDEGILEVLLFISHFSDHEIVLSGEAKAVFPWNGLAVALGSTVVLLMATAYLFKKKD